MASISVPFAENFVGVGGNDGTEGEDERMNVFHVEVISGHGVRHGVVGQNLQPRARKLKPDSR